jgi:hypothetical protein
LRSNSTVAPGAAVPAITASPARPRTAGSWCAESVPVKAAHPDPCSLRSNPRKFGDFGGDALGLVANSAGTLLIPVPISPPKMDGIEPSVRWGAARLGGSCHAWGDARSDRALGCVDCDARIARARYSYQSHTMRALRAVAYLTNALQVRTLVQRGARATPTISAPATSTATTSTAAAPSSSATSAPATTAVSMGLGCCY